MLPAQNIKLRNYIVSYCLQNIWVNSKRGFIPTRKKYLNHKILLDWIESFKILIFRICWNLRMRISQTVPWCQSCIIVVNFVCPVILQKQSCTFFNPSLLVTICVQIFGFQWLYLRKVEDIVVLLTL